METTVRVPRGASIKQSAVYPLWSGAFWGAFGITMRPYLFFISGVAAVVGMCFIDKPEPIRLWLGFLPLFLSCGLGQALTDCTQTDTDAISSPYRPLVQGVITPRQVFGVSLTGLTLCTLVLALLNPEIILLGAFAVSGLITYTWFKRRWWGGPFWNSWIVALLPILGRLVDPAYKPAITAPPWNVSSMAFVLAIGAIFFGYMNFVVAGYLKDISADRATGYNTFAVKFGWVPTAIYSDLTAILAATCTAGVMILVDSWTISGLIAFSGAITLSLRAQWTIHMIRDEALAHGPIAHVVRVYLLLALAIILTLQPTWVILAAIFYLGFEVVLRIRPERTQV
ncbi:UbiA family prenyltransferase [Gemmatimonadota bacterium]